MADREKRLDEVVEVVGLESIDGWTHNLTRYHYCTGYSVLVKLT